MRKKYTKHSNLGIREMPKLGEAESLPDAKGPSVTVTIAASAFLAGSVLRARVDVTAPDVASSAAAGPHDPAAGVRVDWAGVQLHGHMVSYSASAPLPTAGAALAKGSGGGKGGAGGGMAMPDISGFAGPRGACILRGPAEVLVADATVAKGTTRSFVYEARLPADIPPTFRGRLARFAYYLTVAVCPHREGEGQAGVSPGKGAGLCVMHTPVVVLLGENGRGLGGASQRRPSTPLSPSLPRRASAKSWGEGGGGPEPPLSPGVSSSGGHSDRSSHGHVAGVRLPIVLRAGDLVGRCYEVRSDAEADAFGDDPHFAESASPRAAGGAGAVGVVSPAPAVEDGPYPAPSADDISVSIGPLGMCGRVVDGDDGGGEDVVGYASLPHGPRGFNVDCGDRGRVCKVTLLRRFFRPGDVVVGVVDFRGAGVRCLQLCVQLLHEESVLSRRDAGSVTGGRAATTVASYQELTTHCDTTSFSLALPMELPPAFLTKTLGLSWALTFEFAVAKADAPDPTAVRDAVPPPDASAIESLQWRVPLDVVPVVNHASHDEAEDRVGGVGVESGAGYVHVDSTPWQLSAARRTTALV